MALRRRALLKGVLGLPVALTLSRGVRAAPRPVQADPRERHLGNLRQITFGGQNAEAYFSPDGSRLIFQSTRDGRQCDQIYTISRRIVTTPAGAASPSSSSTWTGRAWNR
jgi:hypothetical protein